MQWIGGNISIGSYDVFDLHDVQPFDDLIINGGFFEMADLNNDGVVDLRDVSLFVAISTGE